MNILAALKQDHREIQSLAQRLSLISERVTRTRKELFQELKSLALAHAEAEEAVVYEGLSKLDEEARKIVLQNLEEHHLVDTLLDDMSVLPVTHETWSPKFKLLQSELEHHIVEEENRLLPLLARLVPHDEQLAWGERFRALRLSGVQNPDGTRRGANHLAGHAAGERGNDRSAMRGHGDQGRLA